MKLFCGGYKMLEQKMLEENIKAHSTSIEEGNNVDSLRPPFPLVRHEIWKGARIKPSGTWSSKESERTAERIVTNKFSMCYFKFNVLKFDNFF